MNTSNKPDSTEIELIALRVRVRELEQSLAESEDAKSQQYRELFDLSHDLVSPIYAALSCLQLARKFGYSDQEKLDRTISRSISNIELLSGYIDSILDLARIESGRIKNDFVMINLTELVLKVIESLSVVAQEKNIVVYFPDYMDRVEGELDQSMVMRLIDNLLSNAIKFSPSGTRVTVKIKEEEGVNHVWVSDQGPGIPEEEKEKIFVRYFRGLHGGKTKGIGLGLSLARSIAELHNGTINLENSLDSEGATFHVALPKYRNSAGNADP